jgi:hypothetical protein
VNPVAALRNRAGRGAAPEDCDTCLAPECEFPAELSPLSLVELQVLHSRLSCQLDREYLENPEGPHPVTQDRFEEVVAALEQRGRARHSV